MSTPVEVARPEPSVRARRWLPSWLQTHSALRAARARLGGRRTSAIVVTGGAVRLTDSGLGCPTWPKCTDGSLTPTKQYAIHGVIEFTNRQLTFVLAVIALADPAWWRWCAREQRALAALGRPGHPGAGGARRDHRPDRT